MPFLWGIPFLFGRLLKRRSEPYLKVGLPPSDPMAANMYSECSYYAFALIGKDEVASSNLAISSQNQSEMAGFFVALRLKMQEIGG